MDYRALIPFATPRQAEYLQACIDHGSQRKAAKALGINLRGLERSIALAKKSAAKRGYAPDHDMTHTAPSGFSIKGTSTLYGDDGAIKQQWVKTKQEQQDLQELLEQFSQGLADESLGKFKARKGPKVQDPDLMACYVIGDAHLGMYAQADETGVEDFDTDIARNDLIGAFRHLTHSAPKAQVGVLVNVGDFLHANDTTSTTPSSKHLLDTDGRFSRVVDQAEAIFHAAVQLMLAKHQEVWIVNARGNHDPDAAMWINKILRAYYHDEPRVTVLENETKFIYWQWGATLIGVHHGDRIKRQQIYEAMTRDKRREWGEADHVYFWTGHIHHKSAEEIGGCLFESFNTLAAPDAWHAGSGYGANREMQQITLHKDHGIVARNVCGLAMARLAA